MWTIISISVLCALLVLVIVKQTITVYVLKTKFKKQDMERLLRGLIKANLNEQYATNKSYRPTIDHIQLKIKNSLWIREQYVNAIVWINYDNRCQAIKYYLVISNSEARADLQKNIKQFLIVND